MPITIPTSESIAMRPETFRLPKPGNADPYFGFSRSFYYEGEKRGYWKLVRIRDEAEERKRGVTLVPYAAVAAFVYGRMEAQGGEARESRLASKGGSGHA